MIHVFNANTVCMGLKLHNIVGNTFIVTNQLEQEGLFVRYKQSCTEIKRTGKEEM